MDKKIIGFLALAGGLAVLAGLYIASLRRYPLELIGGIVAVIGGLLGLFDKYG